MALIFDDVIFSLQQKGGVSTYWNELTTRMPPRFDVFRILPRGQAESIRVVPPANTIVERVPPGLSRYLPAKTPKLKGPAIFHSSYYRMPTVPLPFVVTVYDFIYERYRKGLPRFIHSWQKNNAIRHADAVICISEQTRVDLCACLPDVDPKSITVIPLGASDVYQPAGRTGMGAHSHDVIYVGDRSKYKRFELAMQAIRALPQLKLSIVGGDLTLPEHEALNRCIPGRWVFKGRVSTDELIKLYAEAFALVYPSDYEGFGLPIVEAMRCGCPVVCSSRGSLPEAGGEAALYAKTQSPSSYAEQLATLFDMRRRERVIQIGLAHAGQFTWQKCIEKTIAVYEAVIARRYGNVPS